jgi:hypothetical protein
VSTTTTGGGGGGTGSGLVFADILSRFDNNESEYNFAFLANIRSESRIFLSLSALDAGTLDLLKFKASDPAF